MQILKFWFELLLFKRRDNSNVGKKKFALAVRIDKSRNKMYSSQSFHIASYFLCSDVDLLNIGNVFSTNWSDFITCKTKVCESKQTK